MTEHELNLLPDAHLLYPGSRVRLRIGADQQAGPSGDEPDPAYAGAVAVTRATPAALLDWYDRTLVGRGYARATYYRNANQLTGRAWTLPNGRQQVQVAVDAVRRRATSRAGPSAFTRYQEMVVDYRRTGPPPPP